MPEWQAASMSGLLAAVLAALGAIFLRLGDHGERLARLEANVQILLDGHKVVNSGPGS